MPSELLKRAPKQRALWELLSRADVPVPVARALREASAAGPSLQGLVARGLARIESRWSATYLVNGPGDGKPVDPAPDSPAWSHVERSLKSDTTGTLIIQGPETDRWMLYAAAAGRMAARERQALS